MRNRLGLGALMVSVIGFGALQADPVGDIFDLAGDVKQNDATAMKGGDVNEADKFETGGPGSFMQVNFDDNSTVKLGPNSDLVIETKSKEKKLSGLFFKKETTISKSVLNLNKGSALVTVKGFKQRSSSFEVRTPTAVAGVRGTRFLMIYTPATLTEPAKTQVFVFEGVVDFSVPQVRGRARVRNGKGSTQQGNDAPSDPTDTTDQERNDVQDERELTDDDLGLGDDGRTVGDDGSIIHENVNQEVQQQTIRDVTTEAAVTGDGKPVPEDARIELPGPPDPPADP